MRYISLSDDCINFDFSTQTTPNILTLTWNVPHDFSNVAFIGINSINISSLRYQTEKNHPTENHVKIYTNLIRRTVTNPKRRILDIKIPKNSNFLECKLNMSKNFILILFIYFLSGQFECCVDQIDQIVFTIENVILKSISPSVNIVLSLNNA